MKKLTQTKKILVICVAFNVVIFAIYGFFLWAIYAKASFASDLVFEAAEDVQKDEELRAIKASLSEHAASISKMDDFFVAEDGVVSFISFLEQLGSESGIELSIGSVEVEEKDEAVHKEILHLHLESEGSWRGTFTFFTLLENLPYPIEIVRATFALAGASDSILFSDSPRNPSAEESWRGDYQIRVHKLRPRP